LIYEIFPNKHVFKVTVNNVTYSGDALYVYNRLKIECSNSFDIFIINGSIVMRSLDYHNRTLESKLELLPEIYKALKKLMYIEDITYVPDMIKKLVNYSPDLKEEIYQLANRILLTQDINDREEEMLLNIFSKAMTQIEARYCS